MLDEQSITILNLIILKRHYQDFSTGKNLHSWFLWVVRVLILKRQILQ